MALVVGPRQLLWPAIGITADAKLLTKDIQQLHRTTPSPVAGGMGRGGFLRTSLGWECLGIPRAEAYVGLSLWLLSSFFRFPLDTNHLFHLPNTTYYKQPIWAP